MRKILLFVVFAYLVQTCVFAEDELSVSADSAILMCEDSGKVLYAKNEKEKKPMASTTKIMTAILALEYSETDNKDVKITDEMVKVEGSSMGLLPGYVISIENIVKGMMMCSGNDAATTLAYAISGNTDSFANLMNDRAKQIGMLDTHFVTPSGLDDPEHYSTAYDMALLGSYAMENSKFSDIVSQKSLGVKFVNPDETRTYKNHNRLLKLYDGCNGIKTGFTKKSGRCLVSSAQKDGVKLVSVTLDAPNDWDDHIKMYDYGFSKLKSLTLDDESTRLSVDLVGGVDDKLIVTGSKSNVTVFSEDESKIEKFVEVPQFVYAPITKGQIIGRVVYKSGDNIIACNNLISTKDECAVAEDKKSILKRIFWFLDKN